MKRIFIYNFLNAFQIFLGFIFQMLFARYFGASLFTDAYFVSMTILGFVSTVGQFFTEMFMQYYNDIRVEAHSEAKKFYQSVFNFSLLISIVSFIIAVAFMSPLLKIFVSGFDAERIRALRSFFSILAFNLIWARLIALNNSLINAEMRFMVPYLIGLLTPAFNIIFLLLFAKDYGINAIAVSILLSGIAGLALQQFYISRLLDIGFGTKFWHSKFKDLIKKSFSMRLGHQIWTLKDPITTNILSHFPTGTVSLYFYAFRIISVLFAITNSPILQIFSSKVSRLVSEVDFSGIKKLLKRTCAMNTGLFLIVLIPFAIALPEVLRFFFGNKFSPEDVKTIHYVFLALIPFHLILSIELPFVNITIALKQSLQVIRVAIVFIVIFGASVFILQNFLDVYTIPIALMIAQTQNLVVYVLNVQKVFKENLWNVQPAVIR